VERSLRGPLVPSPARPLFWSHILNIIPVVNPRTHIPLTLSSKHAAAFAAFLASSLFATGRDQSASTKAALAAFAAFLAASLFAACRDLGRLLDGCVINEALVDVEVIRENEKPDVRPSDG